MILNSFDFLIMLPAVLIVYACVAWMCRNSRHVAALSAVALTAISYGFFITYQPAGALFLFVVTMLTWVFSLILHRTASRPLLHRRILVTAFATLVLAPLLVFKYSHFIADLFSRLAGNIAWDAPVAPAGAALVVPLGISFFTFQAIGYMWDVYREKVAPERNFLYYMLFVGFFPQIASGPISKAAELLPQIRNPRTIRYTDFTEGARYMLWGYFLKAVVADRLATFVNPVYADYSNFSGLTCFTASVFYSLQIYGDFAGYSLIALGVGRLFGFDLINNFRRPYLSHSVTEFWRRWHISLTRWLKDYVYIPLGGNRRGRGRTYGNIMATFAVSGLWHGANLTFIIWGAIHGFVQCIERLAHAGERPKSQIMLFVHIAVTFLIVNFAWIFFRLPSMHDAVAVIRRIFTLAPGAALVPEKSTMALITFGLTMLFVSEIAEELGSGLRLLRNRRRWVRYLAFTGLLFIILTMGVLDSGQFIYVNF